MSIEDYSKSKEVIFIGIGLTISITLVGFILVLQSERIEFKSILGILITILLAITLIAAGMLNWAVLEPKNPRRFWQPLRIGILNGNYSLMTLMASTQFGYTFSALTIMITYIIVALVFGLFTHIKNQLTTTFTPHQLIQYLENMPQSEFIEIDGTPDTVKGHLQILKDMVNDSGGSKIVYIRSKMPVFKEIKLD